MIQRDFTAAYVGARCGSWPGPPEKRLELHCRYCQHYSYTVVVQLSWIQMRNIITGCLSYHLVSWVLILTLISIDQLGNNNINNDNNIDINNHHGSQ